MRSFILSLVISFLPLLAWASPPATQHAVLSRTGSATGHAERDPHLEAVEAPSRSSDHLDLDLPIRIAFPRYLEPTPGPSSLDLRLGELPPESLFLRVELNQRFSLYVTADLDGNLPRLDALDGDTYFSTGAELALSDELLLYVEDFQPASMVLGEEIDPEEPTPLRSWDGHQVALGFRWSPHARVRLDVACVLSVLSSSGRADSVGALAGLTFLI